MNAVGGGVTRVLCAFPGETASLEPARLLVCEFLMGQGYEGRVLDVAKLIVSELATNAIQFSPAEDYTVVVELAAEARTASIGVRSTGARTDIPDPAESTDKMPDTLAVRGRGLAIVRGISEAVRVVGNDDGTVSVTAEFSLVGNTP